MDRGESVTEQTDEQVETAAAADDARDDGASEADFDPTRRLSTAPEADRSVSVPRLGTVELLRWMWRQLTSMRIALTLLFLLSVAAIPGSLLPQREIDPSKVIQFYAAHKSWAPNQTDSKTSKSCSLSRIGAIYCLLFVSLIGCILP